jgi:hypothetical protein
MFGGALERVVALARSSREYLAGLGTRVVASAGSGAARTVTGVTQTIAGALSGIGRH